MRHITWLNLLCHETFLFVVVMPPAITYKLIIAKRIKHTLGHPVQLETYSCQKWDVRIVTSKESQYWSCPLRIYSIESQRAQSHETANTNYSWRFTPAKLTKMSDLVGFESPKMDWTTGPDLMTRFKRFRQKCELLFEGCYRRLRTRPVQHVGHNDRTKERHQ